MSWYIDLRNFSYLNFIPTATITLAVVIVCVIILHQTKLSKPNHPPGPYGIPIFGYLPFMDDQFFKTFQRLGKIYGHVFQVNLGGTRYIILNSYDAIKEAYRKQADNFAGRPQEFNINQWIHDNRAFNVAEGKDWTTHRSFFLAFLHEAGIGTVKFEPQFYEIVSKTLNYIQDTDEKPCDFYDILSNGTLNTATKILYNEIYDIDDDEAKLLLTAIRSPFFAGPGLDNIMSGNWISFKFTVLFWRWNILKNGKKYLDYILNKKVDQHLEQLDANDAKDFIDAFLVKFKDHSANYREYLIPNLIVSLIAGIDTTSNTLYFALNLLTNHPEIQEKCYQEIADHVGLERLPSMADRKHLTYMEAVISEIHRFASLVPMGVGNENFEETTIMGYDIPKRSKIFPNLYNAMRDKRFFANPDGFDPNHFLDESGKYKKSEALVPFHIGKRFCAGESLANMELFLFLSSIIQRFRFLPLPNQKAAKSEIYESVVRRLLPFKIRAVRRF